MSELNDKIREQQIKTLKEWRDIINATTPTIYDTAIVKALTDKIKALEENK